MMHSIVASSSSSRSFDEDMSATKELDAAPSGMKVAVVAPPAAAPRSTTIACRALTYAVPVGECLPGCSMGLRQAQREAAGWGEGGELSPPEITERLPANCKALLKSIDFLARPGELTVLIGPSGSGKTTLLNVLAQRSPKKRIVTGRVRLVAEGDDTGAGGPSSASSVQRVVNYVMAHDKLLPYLTVEETLTSAAALKLPSLSREERCRRVDRVIAEMRLEKCRHTFIGGDWCKGVSTGELKRVAIGVELLDEPSVLILDEPTTGLDSSLCLKIVEILKREAGKGRTVIATMHQPASQLFALFDTLVILAKGQVVYHGRAADVLPYFARMQLVAPKDWSPCDFLLDLVADKPGGPGKRRHWEDGADDYGDGEGGGEAGIIAVGGETPAAALKPEGDGWALDTGGAFAGAFAAGAPDDDVREKLLAAWWASEERLLLVDEILTGRLGEPGAAGAASGGGGRADSISPPPVEEASTTSGGGGNGSGDFAGAEGTANAGVPSGSKSAGNHELSLSASMLTRDRAHERTLRQWLHEVRTLWWRMMRNSVRNPLTCLIALLVQLMQGLILGGVFFAYTADVKPGGAPEPMLADSFWASPWVAGFIDGVDGAGYHPLMHAFEGGLDGDYSFILSNPTCAAESGDACWQDPIKWLTDDVVTCLYRHFNLAEKYPALPSMANDEPAASYAEWTPERIYENVMAWYQLFDFLYPRENYPGIDLDFIQSCDDQFHNDPIGLSFYLCLLREGRETISPFTTCVGLPDLPSTERRLADVEDRELDFRTKLAEELFPEASKTAGHSLVSAVQDSAISPAAGAVAAFAAPKSAEMRKTLDKLLAPFAELSMRTATETVPRVAGKRSVAAGRRRLLSLGNSASSTMGRDIKDFLGPNIMEVLRGLEDWVTRLTSCDQPLCQSLDTFVTMISDFLSGTVSSLGAILHISGCLFFIVAVIGFASYDVLLSFPQERALFNRETANGLYTPSSYFVAKNLADLPLQFGPCFVLVTVFYFLVGFQITVHQYLTYLLITFLSCYAAYGFGYLVSAASPRMEMAMLIAPLTLVIWLLLAGFFLRDGDFPIWINWFKYVSFYRWAFFALVTNQFPLGKFYGTLPNSVNLAVVGVTDTRMWVCIAILFSLGFAYRILGYFALAKTNRSVGLEA